MREFILRALKAKTKGFNVNDLVNAGRMDIVARCVSNALFVAGDVRKDVVFHAVLEGADDPPRTITFIGAEVRGLDYDEKSIACKINEALVKGKQLKREEFLVLEPGIKISKLSFESLIRERKNVFYLHSKGEKISDFKFSENVVFVFGDYIGMPRKTEGLLDRIGAIRISLGKKELFAASCVTIVNYELDLH
ncbi:tRNA (pseudouridine(54)-N(1))-methyltransferase TrmY [Candidatus Woesearchaeota archaeon]|nr:tRNA (pseudouridine(54)-N(1))-methyltransferase TrmY [Candidatus Woesearchaeota archaeon]